MILIITNLLMCICAAVGFVNGAILFYKNNQPLYSQMATSALGCAALGRLYNIAVIFCGDGIPRTFNTGMLAGIGCFLFLFCANFGQMDSLCDMDDPKNKPIRFLALLAPLVLIWTGVFIVAMSPERLIYKVTLVIVLLVIMLASYYNLKHLLIHDVEFGIIRSIRGYNLVVLLLELLSSAEIGLTAFSLEKPLIPVQLLMCVCFVVMIPALKKGGQQWKI